MAVGSTPSVSMRARTSKWARMLESSRAELVELVVRHAKTDEGGDVADLVEGEFGGLGWVRCHVLTIAEEIRGGLGEGAAAATWGRIAFLTIAMRLWGGLEEGAAAVF